MKGSSQLTLGAPLPQALGLLSPLLAHVLPGQGMNGNKAACSLGPLGSVVVELSIYGTDSVRAPWLRPFFFLKSRCLRSARLHRAARRYGCVRRETRDTGSPGLMSRRRLNTVSNRARHSLTTPQIAPFSCRLRPDGL